MSFILYTRRPPYYKQRTGEKILQYIWRLIKNVIAMYPYAMKHGVRYYFDTDYRRQISNRRRRKMRRELEGPYSNKSFRKKLKTCLIERDGQICKCCKKEFFREDLTIDHIIRLCDRGTNETENLQLLCNFCHTEKSRQENIKAAIQKNWWLR